MVGILSALFPGPCSPIRHFLCGVGPVNKTISAQVVAWIYCKNLHDRRRGWTRGSSTIKMYFLHCIAASTVQEGKNQEGMLAKSYGGERNHTRWSHILMLAAAALAVEVAFTVETGYAIPTVLKGGMPEGYTSIMWAFSPILGVFFQSYIGSASDRCRSKWGRRRPFILAGGLAVCFSLTLFAYGRPILATLFHGNKLLATLVSFALMDFFLDQFEPPVRMYLLDVVSPEDSDKANNVYSAMMAFGSFIGSLICAVDWGSLSITGVGGRSWSSSLNYTGIKSENNTTQSTDLDLQVEVVFGITLVVFIICLVITLCSFQERRHSINDHPKELKPNLLEEFRELGSQTDDFEDFETMSPEVVSEGGKNGILNGHANPQRLNGIVRPHADGRIQRQGRFNPLQINSQNGCCNFEDICESFYSSREFLKYISYPTLLLWLTEFFGWFVYVCVNIYFTDYVGEVIYGGSPTATDGELASLYSEGVRIASWFRAFEDILIFVYLLVVKWISDYVGHRTLFLGGHIFQFLTLFITIFQHSIFTMFLLTISVSIFVANLMSIPYALIPFYKVSRVLLVQSAYKTYLNLVGHFKNAELLVQDKHSVQYYLHK